MGENREDRPPGRAVRNEIRSKQEWASMAYKILHSHGGQLGWF